MWPDGFSVGLWGWVPQPHDSEPPPTVQSILITKFLPLRQRTLGPSFIEIHFLKLGVFPKCDEFKFCVSAAPAPLSCHSDLLSLSVTIIKSFRVLYYYFILISWAI